MDAKLLIMSETFTKIQKKYFFVCSIKKKEYLCSAKMDGTIAQLVEQRTENPCVPGSIPGGTTEKRFMS